MEFFNDKGIDREHKDLFLFLAQIKNDMNNPEKIISFFMEEIQTHFIHEETFMKEKRYPYLDTHIQEHNKIRSYLLQRFLNNNEDHIEAKIEAFANILKAHVEIYDTMFCEWKEKLK